MPDLPKPEKIDYEKIFAEVEERIERQVNEKINQHFSEQRSIDENVKEYISREIGKSKEKPAQGAIVRLLGEDLQKKMQKVKEKQENQK